jgi:hypothetical protein
VTDGPSSPGPDLLGLALGGEGAITGTVVCTAVIAYGVGHVDSIGQLSLIIVATVGVYWLAHLHALTIGNALNSGHHPVTALRHAFIETIPLAAASIIPLAVLLVTHLFGADLSSSAWTALWVSVGLLAVYSYLGGMRGGLDQYGRILSALVGASIGLLVALLKVAIH